MSYWNRPASVSSPLLDVISLSSGRRGISNYSTDEFYEIEPAIVLDIILDKDHPYFQNKKYVLDPYKWPSGINKPALPTDLDYTWIGKALVRLVYSQHDILKNNLLWVTPLESNVSEYPLLNEIVGVIYYLGNWYYTRKINRFNTPNANADFNSEIEFGGFNSTPNSPIQGNCELTFTSNAPTVPYVGPPSKLNPTGNIGYKGALGRYFYYNPRIRSLKRREGDLIFESRFGQSIRFAAYDDDRKNDCGKNSNFSGYGDYKGNGVINPYSNVETGGGNPMIIIRNRQRPLNSSTEEEKNVGGYMLEDVNDDGSSIHLTSGITPNLFKTTCKKNMWGDREEQPAFLPPESTDFVYPKVLMGDQITINSDRIIISAKSNEMFHFSKKRMAFVTDSEYTVDAHDQIIFTTNNKTVLNSPAIYLGEYDQTGEPVLLGKTSTRWLSQLCDWLLEHTHWYEHIHPDLTDGSMTGQAIEMQTQKTVQNLKLEILQSNLDTLLSRRVFVTGGGNAPGHDGIDI